MKQLFDADGVADAVDFKLHAAVQNKDASGNFTCIPGFNDIDKHCEEETYFLCAREAGAGVHCLAAMDADGQPWTGGPAKGLGQACAAAENLDFDKIEQCVASDQAEALKAAENKYFVANYKSGSGIPHIEINGVAQSREYESLLSALCQTGIKAGACSSKTVQV